MSQPGLHTDVQRAFNVMLPGGCVTAVLPIRSSIDANVPDELQLPAARPKRQREFAAGRLAARDALLELGEDGVFPGVGQGRAPKWPPGIVGSIAHDDELAVAVVARDSVVTAVGIDVERSPSLSESESKTVVTDREADWWSRETGLPRDQWLPRVFSFKESLFKCLYPLVEQYFDFLDVEVFAGEGDSLIASCVDDTHIAARYLGSLRGGATNLGPRTLAGCWLTDALPS